jgi:hypothetical protein
LYVCSKKSAEIGDLEYGKRVREIVESQVMKENEGCSIYIYSDLEHQEVIKETFEGENRLSVG